MFQTKRINRYLRAGATLASLLALAGLIVAAGVSDARAAGMLIADGGLGGVLKIEEHNVRVTINNGVALTEVTQVFRNTERRPVEALYVFPVPKGASVANFSMWIGGKEMIGEVVEKKRAREIYESYKRVRRDPGLLEQVLTFRTPRSKFARGRELLHIATPQHFRLNALSLSGGIPM